MKFLREYPFMGKFTHLKIWKNIHSKIRHQIYFNYGPYVFRYLEYIIIIVWYEMNASVTD